MPSRCHFAIIIDNTGRDIWRYFEMSNTFKKNRDKLIEFVNKYNVIFSKLLES